MPYRLLFLDLDGTLVGRRDIVSPRNLSALQAANEAGCTVVICTARYRFLVEKIAAQWTGHGYGIFMNGSVIAEWETGMVLQKIPIPLPAVHEAARTAREHGLRILLFGVDVEDDGGRAVYTERGALLHRGWLDMHEDDLVYADDLLSTSHAPACMGVFGDRGPVEAVAASWRRRLKDVDIFCAADPKYDGWCCYCNSADANKAAAARRVAHMLDVPREQVMAIGDHVNDIDLLRWAGLGVAMGDGHVDAHSAADHVTTGQEEDGVADAIERFVLGRF